MPSFCKNPNAWEQEQTYFVLFEGRGGAAFCRSARNFKTVSFSNPEPVKFALTDMLADAHAL